jgi:hypothetical protein
MFILDHEEKVENTSNPNSKEPAKRWKVKRQVPRGVQWEYHFGA